MSGGDVAASLVRLFDAAGVDRLYGVAAPGLDVTRAPASLAPVLAAAHRWVHNRPSGVCLGPGRFGLGQVDQTVTDRIIIGAVDDIIGAAHEVVARLAHQPNASVELVVGVDLTQSAPVWEPTRPEVPDRWLEPAEELVDQVRAARRPMVLAGPGVIADDAVPGLHALAAAAELGVLNTWGAKGVFDWRSRHHWATVGLQAHDLERGGVAQSDLVVLTGIDPDEIDLSGLSASAGGPVVTVHPWMLGPLAERWSRSGSDPTVPPLRTDLAGVTQRGWTRTSAPLAPTKVTAHYAQALVGGGFVAASPGRTGYWVARTFATTFLGGARVPARRHPAGMAVACAIVGGGPRPGPRRPLAVADGPLDDTSAELLDLADQLGVPVALELWDPQGACLDADEHQNRLAAQLASPRSSVASLATDRAQLDEMIEVAGPVTAWGGLTPEESR